MLGGGVPVVPPPPLLPALEVPVPVPVELMPVPEPPVVPPVVPELEAALEGDACAAVLEAAEGFARGPEVRRHPETRTTANARTVDGESGPGVLRKCGHRGLDGGSARVIP
jgi:hypothetical protein